MSGVWVALQPDIAVQSDETCTVVFTAELESMLGMTGKEVTEERRRRGELAQLFAESKRKEEALREEVTVLEKRALEREDTIKAREESLAMAAAAADMTAAEHERQSADSDTDMFKLRGEKQVDSTRIKSP